MKNYRFLCSEGHEFEARFKSLEACRGQMEKGLVMCPYCHSATVEKLLSVPAVRSGARDGGHGSGQGDDGGDGESRAAFAGKTPNDKELRAAWRKLYEHVRRDFDDVGDDFADEARRIHYGEVAERGIYGKADKDEVHSLNKEGIRVLPLPNLNKKQDS